MPIDMYYWRLNIQREALTMDYSEFQVNISDFDKPKLDGVSGILRVMNDEEFLRTSIESSVSFLDELIIVYNETSIKSQ